MRHRTSLLKRKVGQRTINNCLEKMAAKVTVLFENMNWNLFWKGGEEESATLIVTTC